MSDKQKPAGKKQGSLPGLGKEGVSNSPHDLPVNHKTYDRVRKAAEPAAVPTPTNPDDDRNTRRQKTENMNAHIPQSVPPDF